MWRVEEDQLEMMVETIENMRTGEELSISRGLAGLNVWGIEDRRNILNGWTTKVTIKRSTIKK